MLIALIRINLFVENRHAHKSVSVITEQKRVHIFIHESADTETTEQMLWSQLTD